MAGDAVLPAQIKTEGNKIRGWRRWMKIKVAQGGRVLVVVLAGCRGRGCKRGVGAGSRVFGNKKKKRRGRRREQHSTRDWGNEGNENGGGGTRYVPSVKYGVCLYYLSAGGRIADMRGGVNRQSEAGSNSKGSAQCWWSEARELRWVI